MAIARVQSNTAAANGGSAVPTLNGVASGSLLVLTIESGAVSFTPAGWTLATSNYTNNDTKVAIFYKANVSAGTHSVTLASGTNPLVATLIEYSGAATTSPLQAVSTGTTGYSTSATTGSIGGTTGGVRVTAIIHFSTSGLAITTPPSGYTVVSFNNDNGRSCHCFDKLVATTANENVSVTLNGSSPIGIAYATFLPAAPVDTTPPTVSSASINSAGTQYTQVHDEIVTGGAGGLTITPSGGAATLTYLSGTGTTTLVYTISRVIAASETVTRTYVSGSGNIIDASSNALASFTTQAVTNNSTQVPDTTPPTVSSVTVDSAGTSVTIVFDEAVTLSDATGLTLDDGGSGITLTYVSGDTTDTLIFTPSRTILDVSDDGDTLEYNSGIGNITDIATNALESITGQAIVNNSTQVPDTTKPTIVNAAVTESEIQINFDEEVVNTTGLTLTGSTGTAITLSNWLGGGTATYYADLSRAPISTESLLLTYTPGDIEDLAGNTLDATQVLVSNLVNDTPGSTLLIGPGLIQ